MHIQEFYHPPTFTLTYLVWDDATKDAVVIDPVLDFDAVPWQTSTNSVERIEAFIRERGLNLRYVLETHAHADHLSGSQYLRDALGAKVAISEHIRAVQETFKPIFGLPELATDGSQFDLLLSAPQRLRAGSLVIDTISTPGHTPACLTYQIEDAIFTGDALFMDDYGTGRCDFPRGSAADLYASLVRLYALPDATRVFVGHDYQPGGRALAFQTTIAKSKANNPYMRTETTERGFIKQREERDAKLSPPKLLFQSVQVNIAAGRLPQAEPGTPRRLSMPLNLRAPTDDAGRKLKTPKT